MQVISVDQLTKTYGSVAAVDAISFEVEEGEIFGIVGPNGSGKTTTVECLQGLRRADGGTISVLGLDPQTDRAKLRVQIGSQLQESALPDRIKVREAIELFASFAHGGSDWRDLIGQWGLREKENEYFANLSGGQRQRLFVALALVSNPKVVFLDEMTTGLDPAARRDAWQLIENVRNRGTTILLVTHFMDEAEHLCDRLAVFKKGRIVDVDTPSRLISTNTNSLVVTFTTEAQDLAWLADVPGWSETRRQGNRVEVAGTGALLAHTAAALVAHGIAPDDLDVQRATLEEAYLRLTGNGHDAVP